MGAICARREFRPPPVKRCGRTARRGHRTPFCWCFRVMLLILRSSPQSRVFSKGRMSCGGQLRDPTSGQVSTLPPTIDLPQDHSAPASDCPHRWCCAIDTTLGHLAFVESQASRGGLASPSCREAGPERAAHRVLPSPLASAVATAATQEGRLGACGRGTLPPAPCQDDCDP